MSNGDNLELYALLHLTPVKSTEVIAWECWDSTSKCILNFLEAC